MIVNINIKKRRKEYAVESLKKLMNYYTGEILLPDNRFEKMKTIKKSIIEF